MKSVFLSLPRFMAPFLRHSTPMAFCSTNKKRGTSNAVTVDSCSRP